MNSDILRNPHARWIIPILAAVLLFVCSCLGYFAATYVITIQTVGYVPMGVQQGAEAGRLAATSNPLYGAFVWICLCSAILLPILALGGGFLLINSYQKKQKQAEGGSPPGEAG